MNSRQNCVFENDPILSSIFLRARLTRSVVTVAIIHSVHLPFFLKMISCRKNAVLSIFLLPKGYLFHKLFVQVNTNCRLRSISLKK